MTTLTVRRDHCHPDDHGPMSEKLWWPRGRPEDRPTSSGAAKALSNVTPELHGKFTGMASCVPTPNVSVVDLICHLETATKYNDIKQVVKQASKGPLRGKLGHAEDQVASCTFDAGLALSSATTVNPVSWHNNAFGYSSRVVGLMVHMASRSKSPLDHQHLGNSGERNRVPKVLGSPCPKSTLRLS